jgi:hypothetical protein
MAKFFFFSFDVALLFQTVARSTSHPTVTVYTPFG